MDLLSIIGVILAFAAVIGGNAIEGGHIGALINVPAALIVFGGTLGAALLQTPMIPLKRAMQQFFWVFLPPRVEMNDGIEKIVNWSVIARKEGLLGLETVAETEPDLFARKGLQLLVDGNEPDSIRGVLEVELFAQEARDIAGSKFYECMGGYAPTIGIIGAVMGLIHVMSNLADPSSLGTGIATAFVATIYGVGIANLILLPIASKIKSMVMTHSQYKELIVEGVISIADGENPRAIEMKLHGYLG
mgnify:CR=1 FL=1